MEDRDLKYAEAAYNMYLMERLEWTTVEFKNLPEDTKRVWAATAWAAIEAHKNDRPEED